MSLKKVWQYIFGKRESDFEFYKKIGIFPREATLHCPYVGRLDPIGAVYLKVNGAEYASKLLESKKCLEREVKEE